MCLPSGYSLKQFSEGDVLHNPLHPKTLIRGLTSQYPDAQTSQLAKDNAALADRLALELPVKHEALAQSSRYATGMLLQFKTLIAKFTIMYWRSPSYNVTRFVMTVRFRSQGLCPLN